MKNIRKTSTGQGDEKKIFKMIAVDLSKQQALDLDSKAIQQVNFTAILDGAGKTRFYFILEEAKETVFEFSQGAVKVLWMQFY